MFFSQSLQPLSRLHRCKRPSKVIFCTTNNSRVLARERWQTFEKNTIFNEHPVCKYIICCVLYSVINVIYLSIYLFKYVLALWYKICMYASFFTIIFHTNAFNTIIAGLSNWLYLDFGLCLMRGRVNLYQIWSW